MAGHLLDSNILILALRAHPLALDLLDRLRHEEDVYISVVSRAEILAGMHAHEEARTMALLDSLPALSIDVSVADRAGRLLYSLPRKGQTISFSDALIAATALEHRLTVVTTNARHFAIPDLDVQSLQAR